MDVSKHTVVTIEYTLTDTDQHVLDQAGEDKPLAYVHGVGAAIPGLEAALEGKSPGESLQVSVPPEEAYGQRNEDLISTVPREMFEGVDEVKTGMQFQAETENGPRIVTVVDVEDDQVVIDANHPLAGVTLNFDVRIRDVRGATEEEISQGEAQSGPNIVH